MLGSAGGEELDGGEEGAVTADREEVVEVGDTVAVVDSGDGDTAAAEFFDELFERRSIGGVDMAVI